MLRLSLARLLLAAALWRGSGALDFPLAQARPGRGRAHGLLLSQKSVAARDLPQWVKAAPSLFEDPEVTESPYPLDEGESTWPGPRLTADGQAQLAANSTTASR
mmetsp:Transcript_30206/g.89568  ORF Transcript_30206/g.89568 Transcript_30206/m.89568 type:complete len:104 (-) Transcript_30206:181-492(-)